MSVLIVGAGPAGAALAYLLARRGIEVTLLERQSDFEREFRGEVLMPSAFDALEQMGLSDSFARVPQVRLAELEVYLLGRSILSAGLDDTMDISPPAWVSQPALLEMLVAESARFPSFRLERGASVRDLLHEGDRVVGVRATRDGESLELRADLVIGADGRASVVRKRCDVALHSDPVILDVVWCKVALPEFMRDRPHARAYLGHGHLLIAAPTPDGQLQIGWVIRKGRFGELRARGIAEWLDELAEHVSPDFAAHLRAHRDDTLRPFLLDVQANCVASWSGPGWLLIGDAAHTMSPVGGQGLNIALRDALVAANELVPALSGSSGPAEIAAACARVEQERMPEVSAIQRMQAIAPRFVLSNAWWSRYLLRLAPLLAFGNRGGGRVFRRFALGITDVKLRV